MLTCICDMCGKTHVFSQIVGNEFEYGKAGFQTLMGKWRIQGVADVCDACFALACKARQHADHYYDPEDWYACYRHALSLLMPGGRRAPTLWERMLARWRN